MELKTMLYEVVDQVGTITLTGRRRSAHRLPYTQLGNPVGRSRSTAPTYLAGSGPSVKSHTGTG